MGIVRLIGCSRHDGHCERQTLRCGRRCGTALGLCIGAGLWRGAAAYMPFRLYEDWQAETGQRAAVQCYEAVLPDPVRNFAAGLMDAVVKRPGVQIRNNTSRSSFGETWQQLTHLHEAVTVAEPIAYPHWENAARIIDFDRALLLPVQLLLLAYPALYLLWLLWKGYQLVNGFIRKKTEAYRQRYRSLIRTEEDET